MCRGQCEDDNLVVLSQGGGGSLAALSMEELSPLLRPQEGSVLEGCGRHCAGGRVLAVTSDLWLLWAFSHVPFPGHFPFTSLSLPPLLPSSRPLSPPPSSPLSASLPLGLLLPSLLDPRYPQGYRNTLGTKS